MIKFIENWHVSIVEGVWQHGAWNCRGDCGELRGLGVCWVCWMWMCVNEWVFPVIVDSDIYYVSESEGMDLLRQSTKVLRRRRKADSTYNKYTYFHYYYKPWNRSILLFTFESVTRRQSSLGLCHSLPRSPVNTLSLTLEVDAENTNQESRVWRVSVKSW